MAKTKKRVSRRNRTSKTRGGKRIIDIGGIDFGANARALVYRLGRLGRIFRRRSSTGTAARAEYSNIGKGLNPDRSATRKKTK